MQDARIFGGQPGAVAAFREILASNGCEVATIDPIVQSS